LYLYAIAKTSVINAVVLGHLQPVFVMLIGFFILKSDRLTKYDYAGIAVMILSGILVAARTLPNLGAFRIGNTGDLVVLIATVFWATTTITMRKYLTGLNSGLIVFYRYAIASCFFITYLVIKSSFGIQNIYQILIGLVVGIGAILYYEGLKRIKAAQVSALELSTPFFAAALSFIIIKDTITALQIIGILLLALGVYFISRKER
jgi:drug/metabolite transporter (DMT)-like permease